MYAKTFGETVCGINGEEIIVEVDISNGLPGFDIVGLPDTAVKESRERVRAALKNSGLMFPMTRITVNLAPADLRKDGSSLDLPIAVGILTAAGSLLQEEAEGKIFVGELALDGSIRQVAGVLPMILLHTAGQRGGRRTGGRHRCIYACQFKRACKPFEKAGAFNAAAKNTVRHGNGRLRRC